MATFDTAQIVYSFTFSVGSAGGLTFDNSSGEGLQTMQTYVTRVAAAVLSDPTIQGQIGSDWQAVWGPIVYSADPGASSVVADNTMACYYSPSNNMFVIPVAGTNPRSFFDWLSEDLSVRSVVSWSSIAGTGSGNVSAGTATGLGILLDQMKDSGGNTLVQALASFISTNQIQKATVAVGGHSLGGALSPALALFLYNQQSAWDPGGTQRISAFPTAGPTAGDTDFATYYNGVISEGSIVYSSLYNTLDVVPLAWAQSDLETIPSLYDAHITPVSTASPPDLLTGTIASVAQINASVSQSFQSNPFAQVSNGRSALSGTFSATVDLATKLVMGTLTNPLTGSFATYVPFLTNLARFAAQAVSQHTTAYPPLLDITAFMTEYQAILSKNKPSSAAPTGDLRAAVKRLTGIDPGNIDDAVARAGAA